MQKEGVNYWEKHTTVVNGISIYKLMDVYYLHEIHSISIDFVLIFTQYKLDVDVFMEIPMVMDIDGAHRVYYLTKLEVSLYGLKQASINWYRNFQKVLKALDLFQSPVDN